ncbi:hypothetical protein JG688_00012718, partial [Phytophthora aleatoria]
YGLVLVIPRGAQRERLFLPEQLWRKNTRNCNSRATLNGDALKNHRDYPYFALVFVKEKQRWKTNRLCGKSWKTSSPRALKRSENIDEIICSFKLFDLVQFLSKGKV